MRNTTFILLFIIILFSCRQTTNQSLYTVLDESINYLSTTSQQDEWVPKKNIETKVQPFVHIPDEYTLFNVISENINNSESQEQILIVKEKKTLDSSIILLIVHFDPLLDIYVISNILKTKATIVENFNIQLADITGNFNMELICYGNDTLGNSTLDIFQEQTISTETDLPLYQSIFSIALTGVIDIQYQDRDDQEYINKTKPGTPFFILTKKDTNQIHITLEEKYQFSEESKKYEKISERKISDNIENPNLLSKLIGDTNESFSEMIDGAWKFSKSNGILFINNTLKKIEFFDYDSVESYTWNQTRRSLYNRFTIQGYNDYVKFVIVSLQITFLSPNELQIDVYDVNSNSVTFKKNIPLSGRYHRMDDRVVFNQFPKEKNAIDWQLSGTFTSDLNRRINFSGKQFIRYEGNNTTDGTFSLYKLNEKDTIISLKTMSPTYSVLKTENMLIQFTENKIENKILRSIKLTPVNLSIDGWKSINAEEIKYEQIVEIQN